MADEPLRILIVDDDQPHAETVAEILSERGYACVVATSGTAGVKKLEQEEFDVILTDLRMHDLDGLALLRKAKLDVPEAEVLVVTGHGDVKTAVQAMKEGAADYLTKPLNAEELCVIVAKAGDRVELARANRELKRQIDEKFGFEGVIGNSPKMHKVIDQLKHYAPKDVSVLILGETGTGKDLVAKALHTNSGRKSKSFVAMDCTAINENLLEDELFGHEPGSYTGADKMRKGRFEHANGGTLFMDEVGDMPLPLQAKLLRVLENREIVRIGSNDPIKVNVRLISATHKDLDALVAQGTFRQDLLYRLKVGVVKLPPLRERREDIPLLCAHFIKEFNHRFSTHVTHLSERVRKAMAVYEWKGNVRELKNTIESMVAQDSDNILDMDDLPETTGLMQLLQVNSAPVSADNPQFVGRPLSEIERYYVEQALLLTNGNREEAANLLGIGERTVYRMMQDWKEQDKVRQALAEAQGKIESAAKSLGVRVEELERRMKKWGLRGEEA